jgi:hypothetical protein
MSFLVMLTQRAGAPCSGHPVATLLDLPIFNDSYTGFQLQELKPADLDYEAERRRALNRNSKDGVKPMTKEDLEVEHELTWKMVKQLTMSIFKMDCFSLSFPVGFNEQRTFLERSADLFSFLVTEFADKSYDAVDANLRLAYIGIGIIASFHLVLQTKKPWNPALGETYVGQWSNGTMIFAEQISQDPPISCFQLRPQNGHWKIDSNIYFMMDQGLTQLDLAQNGTTRLTFDDGTIYEWQFPKIRVTGILRGDRVVKIKGPLVVRDITKNLEMRVKVGTRKPRRSKPFGIAEPRATTVIGGVGRMSCDKNPLVTTVTGDYAGSIYVDGRLVWSLERNCSARPFMKVDEGNLLPSDSRYRVDRGCFICGDMEAAEDAKNVVERVGRRDKRLRH